MASDHRKPGIHIAWTTITYRSEALLVLAFVAVAFISMRLMFRSSPMVQPPRMLSSPGPRGRMQLVTAFSSPAIHIFTLHSWTKKAARVMVNGSQGEAVVSVTAQGGVNTEQKKIVIQ